LNSEIRADRGRFSRAYLVGVLTPKTTRRDVEDHLDELEALVTTLGAQVAGRQVVRLNQPSPQYLIGAGKVEEIAAFLAANECDLLVFDDDLAAPQQHLWESKVKIAVIDRRKVIIDIFAQRAQTKEARLQVELASLEYTLPRLKRAWTHLERQRGGGGFVGGAGEAQIETDRRLVRDRIARVRRDLADVRGHRDTQRKGRDRDGVPTAALVGYTNSGKSSLMNSLTDAGVLQEDKLFATLDPTTRRLELDNNQPMVLSDTVGFIRKLPHTLVEAFKSTLEEAASADFILHVIDASHPLALEHFRVTNELLKELEADGKPGLIILNKFDKVVDHSVFSHFADMRERVVVTSVHTGHGLDTLRSRLAALLNERLADLHLLVPNSRFDVVSTIHRNGEVLEKKYDDAGVLIHARYPRRLVPSVAEYQTAPW
jgi:GTP-binding protein HflX